MQCQFKDSSGHRCEETAEISCIEGTQRVERVRLSGDLDERILGVADYEPGKYCYYHAKVMRGMLWPTSTNMTRQEFAHCKVAYEEYQHRYEH